MATLERLIKEQAQARPEALALLAPDRPALSYGLLEDHLRGTVARLRELGIGRWDRLALALPDGPEAASAFLAVAAAAVCAPLNPALKRPEMAAQLAELRARAVVVPEGNDCAAAQAARELGVSVLRLIAKPAAAGLFELDGSPLAALAEARGDVRPDDVALLLHTSGTTSRPKRVPLTHANLCASARHVAAALDLEPRDRCLDVMPLFHVHGLVAGLLASLVAGASVACPPGFQAVRFFDWMDRLFPTWYTAVPTMHQAILAHAGAHRAVIERRRLRFVRSSSAPLPEPVMRELEAVFGAPAIEAYGMTEAAHQMASNPLPPGPRKPGSVGLPAGPELAIMDPTGRLLGTAEVGEVVVRGPNVTAGYEDNAEANAAAFTRGWFRTGDLGYRDADGHFFLKGRLKELINRGGEKVAPREVEEALLAHPAVAQAVAFPVPDRALGEDVAAAVVLRAGATTSARELGDFAAGRLADFKLPRRIVFVDEIPTGPTGKLQRSGLAEKVGLVAVESDTTAHDRTAPRTPVEQRLIRLFGEVLRRDGLGIHGRWLDLGGDSLTATQLVTRIRDEMGVEIPLARFFERPTVVGLAACVEEALASEAS